MPAASEDLMTDQNSNFLGVPFNSLWDPLVEAVFDSSPVVSRAGLRAVTLVSDPVLRSDRAQLLLRLARQLPTLAKESSYWLVKVELLGVIAEVPTAEMEFLLRPGAGGVVESYRERCLESVVIPLLGDENPKVRIAAAKALTRSVINSRQPYPFFVYNNSFFNVIRIATKTPDPADVWDSCPVSAAAASLTPNYKDALCRKSFSRVVARVFELLHESAAADLTLGALEALAELARAQPPRETRSSWFCTPAGMPGRNCQAMGYLGLLINLTTSRVVCSDLNAVTNLLTVATMLFEGKEGSTQC